MSTKTTGWYQRKDGSLQWYDTKDNKWYTPGQIVKDKGKAALGKALGIAYRATVLEEAKQLLKGGFNLSKAVGKKSLNIAKSGYQHALRGGEILQEAEAARRKNNRNIIIQGLNIRDEDTGELVTSEKLFPKREPKTKTKTKTTEIQPLKEKPIPSVFTFKSKKIDYSNIKDPENKKVAETLDKQIEEATNALIPTLGGRR